MDFLFGYENFVSTLVSLVLVGVVIVIGLSCIHFVPQSRVYLVERFGKYRARFDSGFHVTAPFIDRIAYKIDLREAVYTFQPQSVITKDNATIDITTVVYLQVVDPISYAYNIRRPLEAVENLTATTLRNVIGEMDMDETLAGRDTINNKLRVVLDETTDAWGIQVKRVEVKDITPPSDIQAAMERQMKAERDKRAQVTTAQAQKQTIELQAEADRSKMIAEGEGRAQAVRLQADAEKARLIAQGEGKAEAARLEYDAMVYGAKKLNELTQEQSLYLQLETLKAWKDLGDGQATKIVVPASLADLTGLMTTFKSLNQDSKIEGTKRPFLKELEPFETSNQEENQD